MNKSDVAKIVDSIREVDAQRHKLMAEKYIDSALAALKDDTN